MYAGKAADVITNAFKHVRFVQPVQHLAVPERDRQDQRIELIQVCDGLAVHVRDDGPEPVDAQCEALVQQLVGHHEPVRDA